MITPFLVNIVILLSCSYGSRKFKPLSGIRSLQTCQESFSIEGNKRGGHVVGSATSDFTDPEKHLLESVTDHAMLLSLLQLRTSMQKIWGPDTPRIIQDYTDHGQLHSQRIAGFAKKLLKANVGQPVSSNEMYLLVTGIYLHDIGMQCDVLKFPEIIERSKELGARFENAFKATTSSRYDIEEQKAIRRNHHYLTAAWIDHAHRTGSTLLGEAAKTIPDYLVDDLMDICLYHSKLPIADCPSAFKYDPNDRKQLIAALLRFSDELDIDSNRVNIDIVMNFRLPPQNSLYWWLHNLTKVAFLPPNVIIHIIRLNPDDMNDHGKFIENAFVAEFQSKNQQVLNVLRQNNIPIVISAESGVREDSRVKRFPVEIVELLLAMQQERAQSTELNEFIQKSSKEGIKPIKRRKKSHEENTSQEKLVFGELHDPNSINRLRAIVTCLDFATRDYLNLDNKLHSYLLRQDLNEFGEINRNFKKFLLDMLTHIKECFDSLTNDKCSVSIKIIDHELNVGNLIRDSISYRTRSEIDRILPRYPYDANTHFFKILDATSPGFYYLNNDLSSTESYMNTNPHWKDFYNACLVLAIGDEISRDLRAIIGFLCIDNKKGNFDSTCLRLGLIYSRFLWHVLDHYGRLILDR